MELSWQDLKPGDVITHVNATKQTYNLIVIKVQEHLTSPAEFLFSFKAEEDPQNRCIPLPKDYKFTSIITSAAQELVVPWNDLQAGDIILKCHQTPWAECTIISTRSSPEFSDRVEIVYTADGKERTTRNPKEYLWTVRRAGTAQKDPKFPHACPRCKKPAYIGFSAVECSVKCS